MVIRDSYHTCIVGMGPAGIGAALTLASDPRLKVLCLDSGKPAAGRSCRIHQTGDCGNDHPCQIISGFGGCSLISGGKLSLYPAGSKIQEILGPHCSAESVLEEAFQSLSSWMHTERYPVEDTDVSNARSHYRERGYGFKFYPCYTFTTRDVQEACTRVQGYLEASGCELRFGSAVTDIGAEDGCYRVTFKQGHMEHEVRTRNLVIAVGRLGAGLLESLNDRLNLGGVQGHLEVGVRLEFPVEAWPDIDRYHGDLKLSRSGFRTYCVCKEGRISPYHLDDILVTDGYRSPDLRTKRTNLGVLKRLDLDSDMRSTYQTIRERFLERNQGALVCQPLEDFLGAERSIRMSHVPNGHVRWGRVDDFYPEQLAVEVREAVRDIAHAFVDKGRWDEALVYAPEINYNGLMFDVDDSFAIGKGLHIIGEATGQFRGILQSFSSGLLCGRRLMGVEI